MDKPLPELPQNRAQRGLKHVQPTVNWATLSTDAQAHLRTFILCALEEAKETVPEEESEEWATAIEHALAELGERMSLGGWLVGLRRTRARRMQERNERQGARRQQGTDATMARKEEGSLRGKGAHPQAGQDEQGHFTLSRHNGKGNVQFPLPPEPSTKELVQSLRAHTRIAAAPSPKPTAKHLLLTVAPPGSIPMPIHQADVEDYEFPRSQFGCIFSPGIFTLPEIDDVEDEHGAVLYGLDTWEPRPWTSDTPLQIVGGTFVFRGVVSKPEYAALTKVLRLSIFSYLSALLDQSLLVDSHVPLHFPKPSLPPTAPPGNAGGAITRAVSTGHVRKHKQRDSASTLWAFISRKKDDLLHRAVPIRRFESLELPLSLARKPSVRDRFHSPAPRSSEDSSPAARSRRFSFIADYKPSFMQQPKEPEPVQKPYTAALKRIEKYRGILSTSVGVTFDSPGLLVRLAAMEKKNPDLRLGGDEKTALMSLLGWEGRHSHGAGMADLTGFVRHQSFSVLYSEYIPHQTTPSSSRPSTPNSSQASTSSLSITTPARTILCGRRRRWLTYRYYARDGEADECLGEAIARMCSKTDEPCDESGCQFKKGEHELRYTHGGVRILFNVSKAAPSDAKLEGDEELAEMWESCIVCGKQSTRVRMQDGTYLLSFAKFLELLIYSANLCFLAPPLCQHTTPPPRPWLSSDNPLPRSRLNISRHFSTKGRTVSLSLSTLEDIYEVRVPRLQLQRTRNVEPDYTEARLVFEADRRKLRREIMQFWQTLSEHMDTLEGNFLNDQTPSYHKSLPRLPSADDAYSGFDEEGLVTPKGHPSGLPPLPPNTPSTPQGTSSTWSYPFPDIATIPERPLSAPPNPPTSTPTPSAISTLSAASTPSAITTSSTTSSAMSSAPSENDTLASLTNLRHKFQRTEQNLYAELSRCPDSNLNDARRSFESAARGAAKRLTAWETKHTAGHTVPNVVAQHEPEWWQSGCHAVPGGNVIVREDDWGSIIAFTLSSLDYHRELANMSINRQTPMPHVPPPTPDISRPSFFSKNNSTTNMSKWFGTSSATPDPDQDEEGWHEPETYSAVISRREHPRDPTSILKLGLPDVLRQKATEGNGLPTSKATTPGGSGISTGALSSAWAKPDVKISMQAADGHVSVGSTDRVDKVLQELEAAAENSGTVRSTSSERTPTSSAFVETHIRRGAASSVISTDSNATVSEHVRDNSLVAPPPLPPKEEMAITSTTPVEPSTPPAQSTMTFTLTNTLSSALKYMLRSGSPAQPPSKHHHALLSANGASPAIDDRPHIKYDWTIGKRLRFSCTAYYAKQFDALRKRCGIDDMFLHSLSQSKNWLAEGGKSRSNFWKTTDDQFIIKTLVNAWNVADLHVLIELGPAYFRYMDATASKPTVLAKLLGFYTVEIKNMETGTTQAKADLLVMENLFYKQETVKTFDLKGIQGRKVKAASSSSGSKTLFDGDWIEGQQRALTLVQPYSKVVLQEAIKADCEFLAKSNIMDYSLLVGIDETHKQIACGLVDTIGSYTFAKTLEYKAKQGLHSGKEVTVIPPNEYQERFVNAMNNYFVACPDKWSRPQDDTKIPSDYRQLPSVL